MPTLRKEIGNSLLKTMHREMLFGVQTAELSTQKIWTTEVDGDIAVASNLDFQGSCDIKGAQSVQTSIVESISDSLSLSASHVVVTGDLTAFGATLEEKLDVPLMTNSASAELHILAKDDVVMLQEAREGEETHFELLRANRDTTTIKSGLVNVSANLSVTGTTTVQNLQSSSVNSTDMNCVNLNCASKINVTPRNEPLNATAGDIYYNSVDKRLKIYNGATWDTVSIE